MAIAVPQHIKDLVKQEENEALYLGKAEAEVYRDAEGYSAGYGHFLSDEELKRYPPGSKVPQAQVDAWFEEDISRSYQAAVDQNKQLPTAVDEARLTSVNYQLGESWNDINVNPRAFKKTWDLMKSGDFSGASAEVLDSEWAQTQTPERAQKFSNTLASLGSTTPTPESSPLMSLLSAPGQDRGQRPQVREEAASFLPSIESSTPTPSGRSASFAPPNVDMSGVLAGQHRDTARFRSSLAEASQYTEDTRPVPLSTAGEVWSGAVQAGGKQLVADIHQFGALFDLLSGDEKEAEIKLNRAERLQYDSGAILNSMGTFEEFLDQPTLDGFFTQAIKAVGQFTPMAISSLASGFTGAAVGAAGKGLLSVTSKQVTREVMTDILKKKVANRKGLGPALTDNEEAILATAYESVRRMGLHPNYLNVARTGRVPSDFPFISGGFWAGAGGQEYVVGSSQALGEFKEAGYKLTDEEAKAALALGIPQAIIGTIGEKLFVNALFKNMAAKVVKTNDQEAAGWMMELARGFTSGLVKGGLTEGATEAVQEELFIQQRFAIDPTYADREANLRRAESVFAGFFAGGARSAPTNAAARVIGKARGFLDEGNNVEADVRSAEKKGAVGRVISEPSAWSVAQAKALFDEGTATQAIWLPTDGLDAAQIAKVREDFVQDFNEAGGEGQFAFFPDQANGTGILVLDPNSPTYETDRADAYDSGFSEIFLRQILGYTEVSDPSHDAVVQVKDTEGNVVWQQTTLAMNADAVKEHARTRFADEEKYNVEAVSRDAAFDERQEAFVARDMIMEGTPSPRDAEAGEVTEAEEVQYSVGGTAVTGATEGFITEPLLKKDQEGKTEEQIADARENRPIMTWPPRDPNELEGMDAAEVNAELDTRAELISEKGGFLQINEIENTPEIAALLETLPTKLLETFKAQSRLNPDLILTPRQNENGQWTLATSPRDVLPGDRINAAERIGDVVTQASRATPALRATTPGWSIRSPDGKVRNVYMGNVVQFGIQLGLNAPEAFTRGTGRISDGFTRAYEALVDNGYELLYEGAPFEATTFNETQDWQNVPIYQIKGGGTISFREAEQGRLIPGREAIDSTTDEARRRELAPLVSRMDARQRYFDERDANENAGLKIPASQMVNPYVEVSQEESSRRFQLELELNEGFIDRADFEEVAVGEEFRQTSIPSEDTLDKLPFTSLNLEGRPTYDPIAASLQSAESSRQGPRSKSARYVIDPSWNAVMGQNLWPQLSNILRKSLGYGGRTTQISTAQSIIDGGFKTDVIVTDQGRQRLVSEIIQEQVAQMRQPNLRRMGKYFRFGDTDLIVIDVPPNPTVTQQVTSLLALGHEVGHAIFHQELARSLDNPRLRKSLVSAWEKDRDAGISAQYEGKLGFEEWFADQTGTWLLREARKPANGVESFFKRLADKVRAVFKSLNATLQRRFTQNPSFDSYIQEVVTSYKEGLPSTTRDASFSDKVVVRNMLEELAPIVDKFIPKKGVRQLKTLLTENMDAAKELMPNDKRHWSVAYFLQPAHNYIKRFSPELANAFYSASQSEEKAGTLNTRTLLVNERLNDLYNLAPTKRNLLGKEVPDLDAFEAILLKAEKDESIAELDSEAQPIRQWLDDFYENHIRGVDSDAVKKRKNFYPRILAIAELQASPERQAALVKLLEEFNPDGPEDIVTYNTKGEEVHRTPGSFEKVVEALVREGQDNLEATSPEVADVSIGTSEARAKYFSDIPNERLRDIGALEAAATSIRRYVGDMTKRLDYLDKAHTQVKRSDLANIAKSSEALRGALGRLKPGDMVRGWRATELMLLRIPDEQNRAAARDAVKAMMGKSGLNMSPAMRKINSVLLSVNVVTYLTFATLASLPDLAGPILRSKDLSRENFRTAFEQVRRYFTDTKELQRFARDVGVISFDSLNTSLMQSSELGFMTPTAQKVSDTFFRAIGLEWYTNFTRTFAVGMGEQFLIRQANENSERSNRFLRELEVSREDIQAWDKNGRAFNTLEGERVQMAIGRFVEESIVRPNAAERPVWASNPYTALVWQLKSFFYAYGKNIVGGAMREGQSRYSEDGTMSSASIPLVLGAVTLLPLTMLGLEIREWMKYIGRGFDDTAFRSDVMSYADYSQDIIDRAGVLGPFGLVLPMLEAGQFGGSWWVPPLGPTAERLEDLVRGKAKFTDYMPGYAAIR